MTPSDTATRSQVSAGIESTEDFADLLRRLNGIDMPPSRIVLESVRSLIASVGRPQVDEQSAIRRFYGLLNQKLRSNKKVINDIYARAAGHGYTFNYPQKRAIEWAVDTSNHSALAELLGSIVGSDEVVSQLLDLFDPVTVEQTRELLQGETADPTKLRKALDRSVQQDVVDATAGPLVWSLWRHEELYAYFGQPAAAPLADRPYLEMLARLNSKLFERNRSLVIRFVSPEVESGLRESQLQGLYDWVAGEWDVIDNHGYLALVIDASRNSWAGAWSICSDVILMAERFLERPIERGYFRWKDIRKQSLEHMPHLDDQAAQFDKGNEGFSYRDTFVLTDPNGRVAKLIALFQKNERDETLLPCPSCRSTDVEGNSYPVLGVKSWACNNLLCPERSIYNRGRRYDFRSLVRQSAIEDPANEIPVDNVRRWMRDVLEDEGSEEIMSTLIRHYSKQGDVVALIDAPVEVRNSLGRAVRVDLSIPKGEGGVFSKAAFFNRYLTTSAKVEGQAESGANSVLDERWSVIEGSSEQVLRKFPSDVFDRAITSPPYYNAKEYAQWPNLYCHLHDMRLVAEQVFRVLKPGSLYVYNVFDYFDNDKTIVFSAMGQRRVPLSALTVDLFRRVGFDFEGSSVWDKGDIEGKRGFNRGNFSPFYQAPFNCWEHVLLFRKPATASLDVPDKWRRVAEIRPVFKMVRGENRYGHTAPFPVELPRMFLEDLHADALILDPFGGSGTTARAALDKDMRCVLIERDPQYAELARELTAAHQAGASERLF
ncbi:site-specific DNA-methyltransferase [Plantactinospora sp. B24E8]|uniref:DNA-methyltransferase n=1 Tax=Plantactinospora sp. B24E8 TaxID=3153567 RepID=UPI00325D96B1